ncbi:MAG: tRNA (guanine(46)-N(7))-methyltransferase TrmB [Hyphomicrobiaceae bacterium]
MIASLPHHDNDDGDLRTEEIRSFGRRRGRKPGARQQRLWDERLPELAVDLSKPLSAQLPPDAPAQLWLEIGFGGAEHLIWQAQANPQALIIGCEPFEDGVVKALAGIDDHGLTNIRLHADDARPLLRWLPEASLDRAFILFPDPWPKRKHVKRRLIGTATLDLLAAVMKSGAELRIGTDIGDYARTILMAMMAHKEFVWPARGPNDWRIRGDDWPSTRYEQKAIREGRPRYYFRFQRA